MHRVRSRGTSYADQTAADPPMHEHRKLDPQARAVQIPIKRIFRVLSVPSSSDLLLAEIEAILPADCLAYKGVDTLMGDLTRERPSIESLDIPL